VVARVFSCPIRPAPGRHWRHFCVEHLILLLVAAGASDAAGKRMFHGEILKTMMSGVRFA
jgi:hypothetical protein